MVSPSHHLPDELLLAYAAGTSEEAHSLLCAMHLTYCAACREQLATLEELGGLLLDDSPVSESVGDTRPLIIAPTVKLGDGVLPHGSEQWPTLLQPYVRGKKWRWQAPGIHVLTTDIKLGKMPVRLFRLAAKLHVPHHTHQGAELSLTLQGGFSDLGESFGPGDIAWRDENVKHDVSVDAGSDCITLVVNEHPIVPLTPFGKAYAFVWRT